MILDHVTTGGPIGGALSFPLPPVPNEASLSGKSDKAVAKLAAQHLLNAVKAAHDPHLKATFSQALSSLNKYLAQDNSERKAGLAGKVNSKSVAEPKPKK